MASRQVNIHEAKTQLSKLVELAAAGEEIVLAKAGKPVARLTALPEKPERRPGRMKGVVIPDDFNDPLPDDLQRLFDGEEE